MKFHHIGIATQNIEATSEAYQLLGYLPTLRIKDPIQKVDLLFLEKDNAPVLELVAPTEETSPVNNILKKSGTTPYHTCYEVDVIEDCIAVLKKNKFIVVVKPVEAIAFEGRKVCFLFHKNSGLIELLEK
jgi:methylmalonyl-CoA/ethylmalonyl-CoA epimerase